MDVPFAALITAPGLVWLAALLVGAVVGSFLNVCIWRLPRPGMSLSRPRRSHCPSCGFAIPWHDNLPVLGWFLLGGRCRSCRAPISMRYMVVEALTALAFALLADHYLLREDPEVASFAVITALCAAGIVVAFIDQDLQIIPDEITLPWLYAVPFLSFLVPDLHLPPAALMGPLVEGLARAVRPVGELFPGAAGSPAAAGGLIALGAIVAAALGFGGYRLFWRKAHPREPKKTRDFMLAAVLAGCAGGALTALALRPDWSREPRLLAVWSCLAGMGVGSGVVLLAGVLGRQVFRKDAMGFGDVKLMGVLGGFAGWTGVLAGFIVACFLGSAAGIYRLLRYRSRYLPFGPYLVAGCLMVIVWPEALGQILTWYMDLFR